MRKIKTKNPTLRAIRQVNGQVSSATVNPPTFDEKCQTLAEALAAVIEDPDCPVRLYNDVRRWFGDTKNLFASSVIPEHDACEVRRDLARICRNMRRVEEYRAALAAAEQQEEKAQAAIAG
jgi:hypothetical protein